MQEIGRGGEGVGNGVPYVTAAIAVKINRESQVACWNELCVSHRAGPGAGELILADLSGLKDFECGNQLLPGIFGAPAIRIGKGRKRAGHIVQAFGIVEDVAVTRFHRPDGQYDRAVHAEPAFYLGKHAVVAPRHLLACLHRREMDARIDIAPHILFELGLEACLA